jgi:hypothetical protein
MELKNNHKKYILMPVATNGIFAETLDLLCGKCFNLSKSVSALQILSLSALNLCVCVRRLV